MPHFKIIKNAKATVSQTEQFGAIYAKKGQIENF